MTARQNAEAAETAFDLALARYKQASADVRRSRSAKRVSAFNAASEALEAAGEASRAALDLAEREERQAARAARLASRQAPVQASLF